MADDDYGEDAFDDEEDAFEDDVPDEAVLDQAVRDEATNGGGAVRDEAVKAVRDPPAAVRDESLDEMLAQYLNSSKQPPILSLLRRQSLSALGRVEAVLGPHAAETLRPVEGAYALEARWAREAPVGTTADAAAARSGRELTAQELADGGLVLAWADALAHPLRAPQFWALLGHVLIVLQLAPDADEELDGAGAGGDAPMTVADAVAKAVAGDAGNCASSQEEGQGADRWRVRQETRQQFKATVTERAAQVEEMDAALRAAEEELRRARRDVDELTSQMSAQQLALERTAMHYSLPGEESEYHKLQVALEASTKAHAGVAAEHRRVVYLSEDAQRAARRELISQLLEAGELPAGELPAGELPAGEHPAGSAHEGDEPALDAQAPAPPAPEPLPASERTAEPAAEGKGGKEGAGGKERRASKEGVGGKEGWQRAGAGVHAVLAWRGRAGVALGQALAVLEEDKVLLDNEMQMLRDMTAATTATALSVAVRRTLLRPPAVTAEARRALAPLLLDGAWQRAETFAELGAEGAAGALALVRFVHAIADCSTARGCLTELQRVGCRVDAIDAEGESAVHACCAPARPALLKTLLQGPALQGCLGDLDVPARSDGWSAIARLMTCSSDKQVRCVELLLDAHASIQLAAAPPHAPPTTLLHLAVRSGRPRPLEAVLRRMPAATCAASDAAGGGTASSSRGGTGGGKASPGPAGGRATGGKLALIDLLDGAGATPLCAAVCAHEHESVRLLLRHHARLLARDASGATPLHHAVVSGDVTCCHTLLAAVPPSARRTLLTAADPTQPRGSLAHRSPLAMASAQPSGRILEAMVSAAPTLFADAAELPLHLRLLEAAMEAPCDGEGGHVTVTLLICHCLPLQQRLLHLMKLCARAERSVLLPIVCKHAEVDVEAVDGRGRKLLHALCAMEPGAAGSFEAISAPEAEEVDEAGEVASSRGEIASSGGEIASSGGGRSGAIDGPALLRALLTAQPRIHLFAIDAGGLTALGRAPRDSRCSSLLLAATHRALQQAVVNLIYCRREGPACAPHVTAAEEELTGTFPGLRVISKPMVGRGGASDDGARAGTFDVVWEARLRF